MRNTKILNCRIPTELHDALTTIATTASESLAWATRTTLRRGLLQREGETIIGHTGVLASRADAPLKRRRTVQGAKVKAAARKAAVARKGGK